MKDAKPLLVITELYLPTKGGTAVWFDEVYRRLGGKEIRVVTAEVAGSAEHDKQHPNDVHRLKLSRHQWLKPESLAMYAKFFLRSLRLVLRRRPVAVHAGRVLPEGLVAWLVARIARVPVVIYAHGEEITTWRQPGKFRAMCFAYRHADSLIANSEFTRAELIKLGADRRRISLVHPGVDTTRFRPGLFAQDLRAQLGLNGSQLLILSVGRLSRRKGFDTVIRALAQVRAAGIDAHHALIGVGEDKVYLLELAQQCGMASYVHFLGHVEMDDLPRWYNACDVFVMPNREIKGDTEGFGMVFIEAAACGKAAVAGLAGGTAAAVLDGITGMRVDGEKLNDVAGALIEILSDAAVRERLGQAALARAQAEFSWESVAAKTSRLIEATRTREG